MTGSNRFHLLFAVRIVLFVVSTTRALAHDDAVSFRQLVKDAELIFLGTVNNVAYRLSDITSPNEDVAIPHTFVTFSIEKIFKGSSAVQDIITLRFEGGPDPNSGDILVVEGVPTFDVGERGFLFVRGNTMRMCPIVGWDWGRYRIVNSQVFTDLGQEVWLTQRNAFEFGPSHRLREVVMHSIGPTVLELDMNPNPSSNGRGPDSAAPGRPLREGWMPPAGAQRAHAGAFEAAISHLVQELFTPGELAQLKPVPSAFLQNKFTVQEPKPSPPPAFPNIPQ